MQKKPLRLSHADELVTTKALRPGQYVISWVSKVIEAYLLIARREKNIAKASITARAVALESLRLGGTGRRVSSPSSSRGNVS